MCYHSSDRLSERYSFLKLYTVILNLVPKSFIVILIARKNIAYWLRALALHSGSFICVSALTLLRQSIFLPLLILKLCWWGQHSCRKENSSQNDLKSKNVMNTLARSRQVQALHQWPRFISVFLFSRLILLAFVVKPVSSVFCLLFEISGSVSRWKIWW